MSRSFDPSAVKNQVLGDFGARRCLNASFEKMKGGGLQGSAEEFLYNVIKCHLVGVEEYAGPIVVKAEEWIRAAIAADEVSGGFSLPYSRASHYEILALSGWLRTARDDRGALRKAVHHWNEYYQSERASAEDPYVLGEHSATYLEAEAYTDFLRWMRSSQKISLATSLSGNKNEAGVAAAVALHKSEGTYTGAEVARAVRKLLDRRMNEWLISGQTLKAVKWLKLAYWRSGNPDLSPKDVILKAYDHLPKGRMKR